MENVVCAWCFVWAYPCSSAALIGITLMAGRAVCHVPGSMRRVHCSISLCKYLIPDLSIFKQSLSICSAYSHCMTNYSGLTDNIRHSPPRLTDKSSDGTAHDLPPWPEWVHFVSSFLLWITRCCLSLFTLKYIVSSHVRLQILIR